MKAVVVDGRDVLAYQTDEEADAAMAACARIGHIASTRLVTLDEAMAINGTALTPDPRLTSRVSILTGDDGRKHLAEHF